MAQSTAADTTGERRVVALVPAFNEEASIACVVGGIRAAVPGIDVLVIDDGSADDTTAIARAAGARVVRLPFNMGYGVALQTGYKYALREGYDAVVQLDGDGQHETADIPALLAPVTAGAADVVLGSRFIGARAYRPPVLRRLGMRVFGTLARLLGGIRFSDVTSGFQALDRDVVRFFAGDRYPKDYPDADVLMMVRGAGFRIAEVPVRMYQRTAGASMHAGWKPVYYVFKMLLSMGLTAVRRESFERRGA